jgi:hypothetical protein
LADPVLVLTMSLVVSEPPVAKLDHHADAARRVEDDAVKVLVHCSIPEGTEHLHPQRAGQNSAIVTRERAAGSTRDEDLIGFHCSRNPMNCHLTAGPPIGTTYCNGGRPFFVSAPPPVALSPRSAPSSSYVMDTCYACQRPHTICGPTDLFDCG